MLFYGVGAVQGQRVDVVPELPDLEKLVGGALEEKKLSSTALSVVFAESAQERGKPLNRIAWGAFLVVRYTKDGDLLSLTDADEATARRILDD